MQIGDLAPDFNLAISEQKTISLKDFNNKYLVLFFYPKDNTPGCTIEAHDFNKLLPQFHELNTSIIGVSKDSLKSHAKFTEKFGFNFPLASDPEGLACLAYNALVEKSMFGKKYMGIMRSTYLIDPNGKIAYIWPKVEVKGHAEEILNIIKKYQEAA